MKRKKILIDLTTHKVEMPQALNEINITKGKEIISLLRKKEKSLKEKKHLIAKFIEVEDEELEDTYTSLIESVYDLIEDICETNTLPVLYTINVKGKFYRLIDLENLNTEDYFDIDNIMKKEDKVEAAIELFNFIYRPFKGNKLKYKLSKLKLGTKCYGSKVRPNKAAKKASIDFTEDIRECISIGYLMNVFGYLIQKKEEINKDFPTIFQPNEEKEQKRGFASYESVSDGWGWYDTLMKLCNDSISERDLWYKKPIKEFLTFVAYKSDVNKEEIRKMKDGKR